MHEPKALLNRPPHERTVVPSSLRLYHFERKNKAPCHSVRTCTKQSPVVTRWEKCTLANIQEEARQESPDRVVTNSGQGGDGDLNGHANGELYGEIPNTTGEHIPVPRGAEVSRRSKPDQK